MAQVFAPRFCVFISLTEVLTPRRDSRRSPWQSHDVRVGPPAVSFVHSTYFCGSIQIATTTTKQHFSYQHHFRPNRRGRFFRAKAQKKIAPDGSA